MKRFVKKPDSFAAVKFTGENFDEIEELLGVGVYFRGNNSYTLEQEWVVKLRETEYVFPGEWIMYDHLNKRLVKIKEEHLFSEFQEVI